MKQSFTISIIAFSTIFFTAMGLAMLTPAYWEHGPLSEVTRLRQNRPAQQTMSLAFNDIGLYPGDFYCPGNSSLSLKICNLSSYKLYIRRPDVTGETTIYPNNVAVISFGKLKTGKHTFFVDAAPNQPQDNSFDADYTEIPTRMKCFIHATRWPGEQTPYHASVMLHRQTVTPQVLWLPAGKRTEIFCSSPPTATKTHLISESVELIFSPGRIILTEIPATSASGTQTLVSPDNSNLDLTIHFR